MTTMSGWKVLLCFAVRQVQQPTQQKKDGKQGQTEYGHTSPFWALLMLVLRFLIVVVRVMPSDIKSARSQSDCDQPRYEENGQYHRQNGQRSHVHRPSPTSETSATANRLAVTKARRFPTLGNQ